MVLYVIVILWAAGLRNELKTYRGSLLPGLPGSPDGVRICLLQSAPLNVKGFLGQVFIN